MRTSKLKSARQRVKELLQRGLEVPKKTRVIASISLGLVAMTLLGATAAFVVAEEPGETVKTPEPLALTQQQERQQPAEGANAQTVQQIQQSSVLSMQLFPTLSRASVIFHPRGQSYFPLQDFSGDRFTVLATGF